MAERDICVTSCRKTSSTKGNFRTNEQNIKESAGVRAGLEESFRRSKPRCPHCQHEFSGPVSVSWEES